jgi:Ca2+-binding RTX toxin-like protein
MLDTNYRAAETVNVASRVAPVGTATTYASTGANSIVWDSQPRLISNLISDQSTNNPAAVAAASYFAGDGPLQNLFIPNVAPDSGLSQSYNSWFTLFGQFFDHGLDLLNKGGSGTVYIPLKADDPLILVGPDGIAGTGDEVSPSRAFMTLTRASNVWIDPGKDGIVGTADDIRHNNNKTTPFVDQNQTYTSHPSHQVFHREYHTVAGKTVATGKLLDGDNGAIANWAQVKAHARTFLGIELDDKDVLDCPLVATDEYGNFIPHPETGFAQIVLPASLRGDPVLDPDNNGLASGTATAPIDASLAMRTGHAFLDDIAHSANPSGDKVADADSVVNAPGTALASNQYDNELLDKHFITGDGRGNENIGLTAIHQVFHSEHNRLVQHVKDQVSAILANPARTADDELFVREFLLPQSVLGYDPLANGTIEANEWHGERLFQFGRFGNEMQYQHLVFEEFGRFIQPNIDGFAAYNRDLNPAIVAEFAHVVYRFGHSLLTESVDRYNADFTQTDHIGLIEAFLNPIKFNGNGTIDARSATGDIVRGMTRQVGNELDEFLTGALRNNLVGLPLDLGAINIARGRDTGVPTLNQARREFFTETGDAQLRPYSSWVDFATFMKNPTSVINFIAAYGLHPTIVAATTAEAKRDAATLLVLGGSGAPSDRLDFLNSFGAWANEANGVTKTGLDNVDFWIGGLAERQMPFGGLLGSTFNFVFETQMESLQSGDRFYYLTRTANLNFAGELENNKFSNMIALNSDAKHLSGNAFKVATWTLEADGTKQFTGLGETGRDDPTWLNPLVALVERDDLSTPQVEANFLRYNGVDHVTLGGTEGNDILIANEGDDTIWGDGGDDRIEGGAGNDLIFGGDGDDIITDLFGDDEIRSGEGDDVIAAGAGLDLIITGAGNDVVLESVDTDEAILGDGTDFAQGSGQGFFVIGGMGDDWLESATSANGLLAGDNSDLVQSLPFKRGPISPLGGADVMISRGADTDFDAESGDDILVAGTGTDRFHGQLGFDWVSHENDRTGIFADMNMRVFDPPGVPGSEAGLGDRYQFIEGLSGSRFADILIGDDSDRRSMVGHELRNVDLIKGLREFLGPNVTEFTGGNIIFGGGGSDIIEGRGGNDLIDGDRSISVSISVRSLSNPAVEIKRITTLTEIRNELLSGAIKPRQLEIVREIKLDTSPTTVDTAVFRGSRAEYDIEGANGVVNAFDLDGDGFITVTHRGATPDTFGIDGVDKVRNIERLQFADQTIAIAVVDNQSPANPAELSTLAPVEDQSVSLVLSSIRDPDNVSATNPLGLITGPYTVYWQAEGRPGIFEDIVRVVAGRAIAVTGDTFSPGDDEVGLRLRARVVYQDADFVIETVYSMPTAPVRNVNDAPVGSVRISDMTPTEGQVLTATNDLFDADGLPRSIPVTYQWQFSTDGTTWTNIVGATTASLTVTRAHVNGYLRAVASYTDGFNFTETVPSAATSAVGILINDGNLGATLTGTAWQDTINGNGGSDRLFGLAGDDILDGGAGNDTLDGGLGADTMTGGLGNDTFFVDNVGDVVIEAAGVGSGADTVNTRLASYTLPENVETLVFQGTRNFSGTGNAGNNRIVGGPGADTLDGGAGNDTLEGGAGDDTYHVDSTNDIVREGLNAGRDQVFSKATTYTLGNNIEDLFFVGVGGFVGTGNTLDNVIVGGAGADRLSGGGGNDRLEGGAGADSLDGGLGNDALFGGLGNDTLNGGTGNDTLTGGAGDDLLIGGAGADVFVFAPGDGKDTVQDFVAQGTGQDRLDISAFGVTSATFATRVSLSLSGADTILRIDGADVALIRGVAPGALTLANGANPGDFIL